MLQQCAKISGIFVSIPIFKIHKPTPVTTVIFGGTRVGPFRLSDEELLVNYWLSELRGSYSKGKVPCYFMENGCTICKEIHANVFVKHIKM